MGGGYPRPGGQSALSMIKAQTDGGSIQADTAGDDYLVRVRERPGREADWRPLEGPPCGASSEIELCGFLPGGTLVVRVDEFAYSNQRRSILSRLLARWNEVG